MSQAYEALMNLTNDEVAVYSSTSISEGHIIIGHDRRITVPDSLKRIAVQYDHNVETVTFDCPRYWDEHDMSEMQVYINYLLPSGMLGSYIADNVTVDSNDDTMMHFDWTISNNITDTKGQLTFLVCVKAVDSEGNESVHWNSERNDEMYIAQGLEGAVAVADMHPDVITQLLTRMDAVEKVQDIAVSAAESATVSAESANSVLTNVTAIQSKVTTDLGSVRRFKDAAAKSAVEASTAAASQVGAKADAVIKSGEGTSIIITDSSDDPLRGLQIMGRTEQFTTTGKNLVDMSGYEFNDSGYTHMLDPSNNSANDFYNFMRAHPGESIVYSMSITGTASGIEIGSIRFYDSNSDLIVALAPNTPHTIKADLPESFALSYIYGSGTGASVKNIQVEFGTEVTDYEPYTGGKPSPSPDYPQNMDYVIDPEVIVSGKNFFDMSLIPNTSTITRLPDGTIEVTQYANSTGCKFKDLAPGLRPGMVVTLDIDSDGARFLYFSKTQSTVDSGVTFTVTQDHLDSSINIYGKVAQSEGTSVIRGIQIRLPDTTVAIDSYSGTQLMTIPHTLRGIPVTQNGNYTDSDGQQWYCDEVNFERGVLVQRVGELTVDSSMTYFYNTDNHFLHTTSDIFTNVAAWETRIFSTHFMPVGNGIDMYDYGWFQFNGNGGIRFRIEGVDSVEALAEWLNGKNVKVIYPYVTPVEIELTADELAAYKALHTNFPTTMILNDRNIMMHVDYNVDTNTYIADEIRKGIEAAANGVLRYVGTALSVTPISEGSNINMIRVTNGDQITAAKGVVAKYNGATYVYDGSIWTSL